MHVDYARADFRPEAEETFERMARALHEIIAGQKVDLIVAAGDSGLSSVSLTKLVYAHLRRIVPPDIVFPLFRATDSQWHTTGVDVTPHIDQARRFRPGTVRSVIFVDDEIGSGATFRACMDLIFAMDAKLRLPLSVFVVAEALWFQPPRLDDINLRFRPFGRRQEGLSMTSRLIPPRFRASGAANPGAARGAESPMEAGDQYPPGSARQGAHGRRTALDISVPR